MTRRTEFREAACRPDDGVRYRFCEFRYDGDSTLSGVAMKYGDTATLPWGEEERFEAGAFGNVSNLDAILNIQHDRGRPVARTGGAGLTFDDSAEALRITAVLDSEDADAAQALRKVKNRLLRGFSIEFIPESWEMDNEVMVITKAELRGLGIVDRPAYNQSRINPRSQSDMDETKMRAVIEEALKVAFGRARGRRRQDRCRRAHPRPY